MEIEVDALCAITRSRGCFAHPAPRRRFLALVCSCLSACFSSVFCGTSLVCSVRGISKTPARELCVLYPVESTEGISEIWFCEPFLRRGFLRLKVGLGLLMVKSSLGVSPKPRFGPNLDSTVCLCMRRSAPSADCRALHLR